MRQARDATRQPDFKSDFPIKEATERYLGEGTPTGAVLDFTEDFASLIYNHLLFFPIAGAGISAMPKGKERDQAWRELRETKAERFPSLYGRKHEERAYESAQLWAEIRQKHDEWRRVNAPCVTGVTVQSSDRRARGAYYGSNCKKPVWNGPGPRCTSCHSGR